MTADKRTIGVVPSQQSVLDQMKEDGAFEDDMTAARFAMSLAISHGTGEGSAEGTNTKWNVGSVDADQSLRGLIRTLYPECETPYRQILYLIHEGLALVGDRIQSEGVFDPSRFLSIDG